jgi:predicted small metal-binding protein
MKLIRCECGFVARGESDDQVVRMIRGHMAADHPTLLETVSREDLVSWIQAELPCIEIKSGAVSSTHRQGS